MTRKSLLLVVMIMVLAACGTPATPEWAAEVEETQVALAATADHLTEIAPTATYTPTPTHTPTEPPTATPTPIPPTATPTATPLPPTETFTPTPVVDDVPAVDAPADDTVDGDPANGEVLFTTLRAEVGFACATCHNATQDVRGVGPSFVGLAARAGERVEGESAVAYIRNSILHPNDFIVPADPPYPENLMPQTYSEIWTEQELDDIISYLLTL